MSGVRGRCFVRVAQGCTGLIGGGDLICGKCYQVADSAAWEAGKMRYNLAVVFEEGDQLLCCRKQYLPKQKYCDWCDKCTRSHIGSNGLANSSCSRPRSRSPSCRLGLPEHQPSFTLCLQSAAEDARLTAESVSRFRADVHAINARILATKTLLATYAETITQLHTTLNQFTADLAVIERTQLSIQGNIRQLLDKLDD